RCRPWREREIASHRRVTTISRRGGRRGGDLALLGRGFVRDRRSLAGGRRDDAMSTQKIIFITGTSSGLGRASVRLFSARGWRVIATMRGGDAQKETDLGKLPGVSVLPLDVTDPAQITSTVAKAVS